MTADMAAENRTGGQPGEQFGGKLHKLIRLAALLVLALVLVGLLPALTACQDNTQADTSNEQSTPNNVPSDEDGWIQHEGYWYYFEDGQMVTSAWRLDTEAEGEAWRYLDWNGQAVSNQRMLWIESPQGAWAWISFNENSHALDMRGQIFTIDALLHLC